MLSNRTKIDAQSQLKSTIVHEYMIFSRTFQPCEVLELLKIFNKVYIRSRTCQSVDVLDVFVLHNGLHCLTINIS